MGLPLKVLQKFMNNPGSRARIIKKEEHIKKIFFRRGL
jgi:hypothetical protein